MTNKLTSVNAGVFKKWLATGIDVVILGIIGFLLSLVMGDFFFYLGYKGWWVGLIVSLLYFSLLQSKFNGQTLGAFLMRISVVTNKGNYLNLKEALFRNFLLLLAFYSSNILSLFPENLPKYLLIFISCVCFSYVATLLVFILFHPQHRGIHDILCGVYVIKNKQFKLLNKAERQKYFKTKVSISKPKKISFVLGALIIVIMTGLVFFNPFKTGFFNDIQNMRDALNKNEGVIDSGVTAGTFHSWSGDESKSSLLVTIAVDRKTFFDFEKLKKIGRQAVNVTSQYYLNKNDLDEFQIRFISGYDIGIWKFNENITVPATSAAILK